MKLNFDQLRVLLDAADYIDACHSMGGETLRVDYFGWEDEGDVHSAFVIVLENSVVPPMRIDTKDHVATVVDGTGSVRLVDHPFSLSFYQKMDLKDELKRAGRRAP